MGSITKGTHYCFKIRRRNRQRMVAQSLRAFKKGTRRGQKLLSEFDGIVKWIDRADQKGDKAAQLHEERRAIKEKLKKLGVQVTS